MTQESQLVPPVEWRLWRLQAQVLAPITASSLEALLQVIERGLPNPFPQSADIRLLESLPRMTRPLPAPFEGDGVCVEVTLSRQCGVDEITESLDAFIRHVSPQLQALCPQACVLFSSALSGSTSNSLDYEAQVGWHLPATVVQQRLGSALMETVAWVTLRSQFLASGPDVFMFREFVPSGAAPPTHKALAHAQQVAFSEEAWEELIPALVVWHRCCRLAEALPLNTHEGSFSRL